MMSRLWRFPRRSAWSQAAAPCRSRSRIRSPRAASCPFCSRFGAPAIRSRWRGFAITGFRSARSAGRKDCFAAEDCRDLVFIGTLVRPALSEIRLDWGTLRVIGKVMAAFRGGDDHLLSGIGRILEQDGFRMVGIRDAAPDMLMPEGCLDPHGAGSNAAPPISPGAAGTARARAVRYRPGRGGDRRSCGRGRGHRRHRWPVGARGAAAQRGAHPRQGGPRRAGQGARRAARICASTCRPSAPKPSKARPGQGLPALPSSPATPSSAEPQAMIERPRRPLSGPVLDRACPRDAGARHRRAGAKNIPDRNRGIRGPARRQSDEGLAPAPRRRGAV